MTEMGDDSDDAMAKLRATVEQRVREQFDRHLRIDPNSDPRRIVDIQMKQERERLDRMAVEFEGQDAAAEAVRVLRDEWLPQLARELKRR